MDYVDAFLEHHGVKGQRWGFNNLKNSPAAQLAKSAAVVGGSAGAGYVAGRLVTHAILKKSGIQSVQWAKTGGALGAYGGAELASHILTKKGKFPFVKNTPARTKFSNKEIYSAQKSLGMKTIEDPTGEYENYHQQVVQNVNANEKAMK